MNIFYLDADPATCARYHSDKHVIKMILESAQLLSTAIQSVRPGMPGLYRPTHRGHPCAVWVRQGRSNFAWLLDLTYWLGQEYEHRFGKKHKTMRENYPVLRQGLELFDPNSGFTEPPQCMPEEYRQASTVQAYRDYYTHEKKRFAKYTRRQAPAWLEDAGAESNPPLRMIAAAEL